MQLRKPREACPVRETRRGARQPVYSFEVAHSSRPVSNHNQVRVAQREWHREIISLQPVKRTRGAGLEGRDRLTWRSDSRGRCAGCDFPPRTSRSIRHWLHFLVPTPFFYPRLDFCTPQKHNPIGINQMHFQRPFYNLAPTAQLFSGCGLHRTDDRYSLIKLSTCNQTEPPHIRRRLFVSCGPPPLDPILPKIVGTQSERTSSELSASAFLSSFVRHVLNNSFTICPSIFLLPVSDRPFRHDGHRPRGVV